MDDSVPAIFMDGGNLPFFPVSCAQQPAESAGELKDLLACASMEVQSAHATAEAQKKLHEERVRQLEELVKTVRRERDEAREQCLRLQESLASAAAVHHSGLSDIAIDLPVMRQQDCPTDRCAGLESHIADRDSLSCNYMHSSMASSPSGLVHIDSVSSMSEPQWELGELQDLPHLAHNAQPSLSQPPRFDLVDPPPIFEQQHPPQRQGTLLPQCLPLQELGSSWATTTLSHSTLVQPSDGHSSLCIPATQLFPAVSMPASKQLFSSNLHSGSTVVAAALECFGDSSPQALLLPPIPMHHLPEPPESDPAVILKSLPEKGKLLQAVMQAGPLLQTLLLAGPLPQWRYPPPVLDTVEIPRVSISSSSSPSSSIGQLPALSQPPFCSFLPNCNQISSIDYVMNMSFPPPARDSSLRQVGNPSAGASFIPTSTPYLFHNGMCSSNRLLRSNLPCSQDNRLTGGPVKYAKIY
eukprot:c22661_g1_i3 orf=296-1699(+)